MGRTKKVIDPIEFDRFYNKLQRGILTQQEVCAQLGISRATLNRRIVEYKGKETVTHVRERVFLNPNNSFEFNTYNVADGLSLLRGLKDKTVDLVIFDPEYRAVLDHLSYGNEGAPHSPQYRRLSFPQQSDDDIKGFFDEIGRVLRNSSYVFLWLDQFSLCEARHKEWIQNTELRPVGLVAWYKGRLGSGWRLRHTCEYLLLLQAPPQRSGWSDRGIPDVWFEKPLKRNHPHAKPVDLVKRLILTVTHPGALVIDPCAGSYTGLEAVRQAGERFFLGSDLNTYR